MSNYVKKFDNSSSKLILRRLGLQKIIWEGLSFIDINHIHSDRETYITNLNTVISPKLSVVKFTYTVQQSMKFD